MEWSRVDYAVFKARLDTFDAPKTKARRPSARGKKAAPKAAPKGGWPLESPQPFDLAYAGFIFKPTENSPDNVACFHCKTHLDGWEPNDTPAHEHLTHSPNCGFAINACIRLRDGDPGRTEDDPLSERMLDSRRETFQDLWPLDVAAGYPSIEQMIEGGWCYDPSEEYPDGATCPYCSLSLDCWDIGDDPSEQHLKRSADCLFFTLKEYYHSTHTAKPKATRGKRSSTRPSIASTTTKKTTRAKKGAAEVDDTTMDSMVSVLQEPANASLLSVSAPAPAKRGRRAKNTAATDDTMMGSVADSFASSVGPPLIPIPHIAPPPKRGRKPKNSSMLDDAPAPSFAESFAEPPAAPAPSKAPAKKGRKPKNSSMLDDAPAPSFAESFAEPPVAPAPSEAPAKKGRKTKKTTSQVQVPPESFAESFGGSVASTMSKTTGTGRPTRKAAKRASTVSVMSTTRTTRGTKRKSEEMEVDVEPEVEADVEMEVEEQPYSPKRTRLSDISLPQFESTPLHTPKEYRQETMKSSVVKSSMSRLPQGTPRTAQSGTPRTARRPDTLKSTGSVPARSPLVTRSPVRVRPQTPEEPQTPEAAQPSPMKWNPIDIQNIIADAGLSQENRDIDMADTAENVKKAVLASLTSPEKRMTIEEFVLHNAKQGEEKLRRECERQIAAFEAEGRRALAALDAF